MEWRIYAAYNTEAVMARAVHYSLTDLSHFVVHDGPTEWILQQVRDPQQEGLIIVDDAHPIGITPQRYAVIRTDTGVELREKTEVSMTATRTTEGYAITCAGHTRPIVVMINTDTVTVTPDDPTILLTSDVPKVFTISIDPHDTEFWAATLEIVL